MVSENTKDRLAIFGLSVLYILIVFLAVCGVILSLMFVVWWLVFTFNLGSLWFIFGGLAPCLTAVIVVTEWTGV